jgi:hypothetical protein
MAWIELHDTLRGHPKTYALAEKLKIPQFSAVGLLTCLWTWALNNAPDGDLARFPRQAIARECYWSKSADFLIDALIECGWVDENVRIHDWNKYAGRLLDKRAQNAERVRTSRARNAHVTHNKPITDDARYGATVPNRTVPKNEKKIYYNAAWRTSARARSAVAQNLIDGWEAIKDDSAGLEGIDVNRILCEFMEAGMSPEQISEVMKNCTIPGFLDNHLFTVAVQLGIVDEDSPLRPAGYDR